MTHVDICLYNIIGQKIATLRNEMLNRGNHVIDIRQAANTTLSTGQYVYQIQSNIGNYSKSVIIS